MYILTIFLVSEPRYSTSIFREISTFRATNNYITFVIGRIDVLNKHAIL